MICLCIPAFGTQNQQRQIKEKEKVKCQEEAGVSHLRAFPACLPFLYGELYCSCISSLSRERYFGSRRILVIACTACSTMFEIPGNAFQTLIFQTILERAEEVLMAIYAI